MLLYLKTKFHLKSGSEPLQPTKFYHELTFWNFYTSQIARSMGPTWGPPGSWRTQVGPMLAPWTLLSGISCHIKPRTCHVNIEIIILFDEDYLWFAFQCDNLGQAILTLRRFLLTRGKLKRKIYNSNLDWPHGTSSPAKQLWTNTSPIKTWLYFLKFAYPVNLTNFTILTKIFNLKAKKQNKKKQKQHDLAKCLAFLVLGVCLGMSFSNRDYDLGLDK